MLSGIFQTTNLVLINLFVQIVLGLALAFALVLIWVGAVNLHCLVIRMAIVVQILAIILVMFPSMLSVTSHETAPGYPNSEILIHHGIGLILVLLWGFINLTIKRLKKHRTALRYTMWTASALWVIALGLGVHLYVVIYT